ncbi:MAG TPA: hypothetical protein VFJ16_23150 [Longimicrobium sp.]|nr:hypothetical protein [Longimicrobium sp.]
MTALAAVTLVSGGCAREQRPVRTVPTLRAAAETPAGREALRLARDWSDDAWRACGPTLRTALAERDRVRAMVDAARDEDERVVTLQADARDWIAGGDAQLAALRPRLEAGACDGELTAALGEVTQAYARAGTAATRALRLAGATTHPGGRHGR